jgi:hypothetical protein
MLKYLQKVYDRLSGLKAGITTNASPWAATPHTPATVQTDMTALTNIDGEIDALEDQLKQKQLAARNLASQMDEKATQIQKIAIGIHAAEPEKLVEYNIALPGEKQPRPVPAKAVIASIADDDDGIGFKLKVQTLANVDFYEWEKGSIGGNQPPNQPPMPVPGAGAGVGATVLQTPYPFWRSSKKQLLIDDDVEPGIRYFYRVRGVNNAGAGAWSEPVSRVQ